MNQQLLYEIAHHRILIDTPNAEVTQRLIPSFQPFRVDNDVKGEPLIHFVGNTPTPIPNRPADDVMEADGMSFDVYHTDKSLTVTVTVNDRQHSFNLSADKKRVTTDLTLQAPYESRFLAYFLRAAYGIAAASHQTIKLHASVIEKEGKALIFMGKSGTGKSTHSQKWLKYVPGCTLLNDDEPILRILKNGTIRVYGAPWSGSTPCYRNQWAQVAAFVRLYQSSENKLTKLKGIYAFAALYQSVAILRSDKKNKDQTITIVDNILKKVPIYKLDNRPDREAVSLTETLLK